MFRAPVNAPSPMPRAPSLPSDWRSLYPFDSHVLCVDGLNYHYLDEGQGETLLMVHGNPTWSFLWRNLVLAFRDRYRVVVPDHIGCGMSDKPQRYGYTLQQHISNLCSAIDQLDLQRVTLLAHDWGGAIGLGAALSDRDRFTRIVLFNTGAFPPPYVPWRIKACRIPLLGTWAVRRWNLFARSALWMASARPRELSAPVRAGLLAPYDNWERRVAIDAFVRDIPLTVRHPSYRTLANLESQLPELASLPIMLIWGMQDWCFRPLCLQRFQTLFPTAVVHRLKDAGHYVLEDACDTIIPLVRRFLQERAIDSQGLRM